MAPSFQDLVFVQCEWALFLVSRRSWLLLTATSISSGFLHGEQSRIQLQLCLASGYNINQTRAVFESEIRAAVYNPATSFYNGTNLALPF
jgi:hypothetical protein